MNTNLSLGLCKDSEPINVPDGFYTFALNALHDGVEGNQGFVSNENANQLCTFIEGDIRGTIPADGNSTVVFSGDGNIYLFDSDKCEATLYKSLPALDFGFPVTGQYKVFNGCERIVYFRDGKNRDRYFNFDKADKFDTVNEFNINPNVTYPCVTSNVVKGGGKTEWGSYTFVVEILDNDFNVVYRTIPTLPVYIGSGSNITSLEEYRPPSTDSIKLTISGLDTEYAYIRVGVIKYTAGDGVSKSAHYVGELLPIYEDVVEYYYRGYNTDNGDTPQDVDQLLNAFIAYERSHGMEQVQGRLVRYNLTEQNINYSEFQKSASKITTKYVVTELPSTTDFLTEQGDEVKAYSIIYLFNNGNLSPSFHIPGRRSNPNELVPIVGLDGNTIPRWKLYNTAIKDTEPEEGYASSGQLGYYQCDSLYTTPPNYCEEDYWGVDSEGFPLVDTPVRHHRIPCRTLEPLTREQVPFTEPLLRYIGTKFENIEYPHPDIVGHFILTNERTTFNSTVVGAGYMVPYNYEETSTGSHKEGRYLHWMNDPVVRQDNSTLQNFISLPYLIDGTTPQGSYIKINGFYDSTFTKRDKFYFPIFDGDLPYNSLQLYGKLHEVGEFTPQQEFINLERSLSLPYKSTTFDIPNNSLSSNFNVLELENEPVIFDVDRTNLNYTYVKQDISVHCNLYAIRYRLTHNCPFNGNSCVAFTGDTFISPLDMNNLSYFTIGDSFLDPVDEARVEHEYITGLYMESPHNFRYRLEGADICNQYYKPANNLDEYIVYRVAEKYQNKETFKLRDSFCLEYYGYNKDYSVISNNRTFLSLALQYNFCSTCISSYPTRIIWSEVSTEESDSYRIYKPLSYTDLPANRGAIISANYKNNVLYVRTEQSLFILQPNPQRLKADGTDIYLSTGDFFGIPPQEMQTTDIGYGGQTSILGQVNCPYGLIWVDEDSGKIFSIDSSSEEISKYKMYHWFERNLSSNITRFLDVNNVEYNKELYGCIVTYDPKFERIIVHKKDYIPLFKLGQGIHYRQTGFHFDNGEPVPFSNKEYFEDKSWTISYSFRTKTWISWHSYQPNLMFYSPHTFYSILSNQIWSHNNYQEYNKYFDTEFPYIIELPNKAGQTHNLHSIHYYAIAKSLVNGQWIDNLDVTFDKAIIYTNTQSTGNLELNYKVNPEDNLFWSNIVKQVIQTDRNYKIAQVRDIAISAPVNSSSWNDIQSFYDNGQGYIDIVPNNSNLDYNREQFELNEFRDKWCLIRLFYNNTDNRITTYIIDPQQFQSVR